LLTEVELFFLQPADVMNNASINRMLLLCFMMF
jgi:hypothetical protein